MYKNCKDSKDQGGFHDFVEILKLYDKNADDTILEFELFKLLVNLGEKLTKEEAKNISPRRNSSQLNIPRPRSLDRSLSRSTPVSWPRQGAQKKLVEIFSFGNFSNSP